MKERFSRYCRLYPSDVERWATAGARSRRLLIENTLLRPGVELGLKTGIYQQDWTRLSQEMEWNRRERETDWQRVCQWLRNTDRYTSGTCSCTAEKTEMSVWILSLCLRSLAGNLLQVFVQINTDYYVVFVTLFNWSFLREFLDSNISCSLITFPEK